MDKFKLHLKLFFYMFQLSALTFGGGYVIVSYMRKLFVDKLHWISEEEMLDFVAISQSSPGPIAVNASIIVGFKIASYTGAFIAVVGTVLPPLIIITVISFAYDAFQNNEVIKAVLKGMEAGIAAIIVDVVISLAIPYFKGKNFVSIIIMVIAFIIVALLKINVVYVILACMIIGVLATVIKQRRRIEK